MSKILRGCRAMWLSIKDATTLIGKDTDDMSLETNPDTEQQKNVLGETNFSHNGYTPSLAVDYIARSEDAIYEPLQNIANTLAVDDESITAELIVATLDSEVKESDVKSLQGKGFKVPVKLVVDSDGGGTSGYGISFTAYEAGNRVQGTVTVSERKPTFTPNTQENTANTLSE